MVSPMPVPSMALFSRPKRLNGINNASRLSLEMPFPVSITLTLMRFSGISLTSILTNPPLRLYLMALDNKLRIICLKRK